MDDSGKNIEVAVMRAGYTPQPSPLGFCASALHPYPSVSRGSEPLTMVSDADLDAFVTEIEAEKEEAESAARPSLSLIHI